MATSRTDGARYAERYIVACRGNVIHVIAAASNVYGNANPSTKSFMIRKNAVEPL